jgi:hypothetical protein
MSMSDESDRQSSKSSPGESRTIKRVEWLLGMATMATLTMAAVPAIRSYGEHNRAEATVNALEEMITLAGAGVVETGEQHQIRFEPGMDGSSMMAVLTRSNEFGEVLASLPFEPSGSILWGTNRAHIPAPGDLAQEALQAPSFTGERGEPLVDWLAFHPQATAAVAVSSRAARDGASPGALYLRSPERDYALVVTSTGRVTRFAWSVEEQSWQRLE